MTTSTTMDPIYLDDIAREPLGAVVRITCLDTRGIEGRAYGLKIGAGVWRDENGCLHVDLEANLDGRDMAYTASVADDDTLAEVINDAGEPSDPRSAWREWGAR